MYNLLRGKISPVGTEERTFGEEPHGWTHNEELRLFISKGVDVPGSVGFRDSWKKQFIEADRVFYLFNVTELPSNGDYVERLRADGKLILSWQREHRRRLHVIGTHLDLDDRDADDILDLEPVMLFKGRTEPERLVIGSLKTPKSGVSLVRQAIAPRSSWLIRHWTTRAPIGMSSTVQRQWKSLALSTSSLGCPKYVAKAVRLGQARYDFGATATPSPFESRRQNVMRPGGAHR